MKFNTILLLLAAFLFFSGCAEEKPKTTQMLSRTQVIMGTFCTLTLEEQNAQALTEGFELLKKTEAVLSSYQEGALVSRLNSERNIPTNPLLKDILEKSKLYYQKTQGYFDITIGSITKKLYHFGEDEKIPTQEALALAPLGIDNIHIDKAQIRLENNISIDLGGIGKGYGVDVLAEFYRSKGIKKGQIALSGDIRCLNLCSIGIQSPFVEEEMIALLHAKVPNLSISTSGTYRRYVKEKSQHHLINPKSKSQGRDFASVTIVSQANNTLCDVMATAISTMPKQLALNFLKTQTEFGYLLVTAKGEVLFANLEKFVEREERKERKK